MTSAALERADGSRTANRIDGPVSVDVVHLDGLFRWLATGDLAPGPYTALRLGFEAATQAGAPVTIVVQGDALRAQFAEPVALGPGEYRRFTADFDLDASLAGEVRAFLVEAKPQNSGGGPPASDRGRAGGRGSMRPCPRAPAPRRRPPASPSR